MKKQEIKAKVLQLVEDLTKVEIKDFNWERLKGDAEAYRAKVLGYMFQINCYHAYKEVVIWESHDLPKNYGKFPTLQEAQDKCKEYFLTELNKILA
jgi:hypothetical protein